MATDGGSEGTSVPNDPPPDDGSIPSSPLQFHPLDHPIIMFGRRWRSLDALDKYREFVNAASLYDQVGCAHTLATMVEIMTDWREKYSIP